MAEPRFADEDDLPRTFRREREARERELRERDSQPARAADLGSSNGHAPQAPEAYGPATYDFPASGRDGTVTRLDIPFAHLVLFFMKAVFAAIPALIVLALMFWGAGEALRAAVPSFKGVHITIWQDHKRSAAAPVPVAAEVARPVPEPKKR